MHEDTDTRAIDNFIVRLRRLLEDDPDRSRAPVDGAQRGLPVPRVALTNWAARGSATILAPCSHPDRYFSPIPAVREAARALYDECAIAAARLPARPRRSANARATTTPFPDPGRADRHPRSLHRPDALLAGRADGVARHPAARRRRGRTATRARSGSCSRDHFHLFRGTPSGAWLAHEFEGVFGIDEPLTGATAMRIYDRIEAQPRDARVPAARAVRAVQDRSALHDRCGHRHARVASAASATPDGRGVVRPTFRPDLAINILHPSWQAEIGRLSRGHGARIGSRRTRPTSARSRTGARSSSRWARRPPTTRRRRRSRPNCRPATSTALFERALAGKATGSRRARVHGPHADGDGAHEHRGRAGDAAASGVRSQPQRAGVRALRAGSRLRHPARRPSTRATCSRCSTSTATTPASRWSSSRSTRRPTRASWRRWPATTRACASGRRGGSTTASRA